MSRPDPREGRLGRKGKRGGEGSDSFLLSVSISVRSNGVSLKDYRQKKGGAKWETQGGREGKRERGVREKCGIHTHTHIVEEDTKQINN